MPVTKAITGNGAMAEAMRQIHPDVVPAFPITPSTQVIEEFAEFVANGEVDTELITVESEHSAMSACLGRLPALSWESINCICSRYIDSGLCLARWCVILT